MHWGQQEWAWQAEGQGSPFGGPLGAIVARGSAEGRNLATPSGVTLAVRFSRGGSDQGPKP